jgi:hypothetical protein
MCCYDLLCAVSSPVIECQKECQKISEDMPDRMSEDMPDRMSEDMPDRVPERMSEDIRRYAR